MVPQDADYRRRAVQQRTLHIQQARSIFVALDKIAGDHYDIARERRCASDEPRQALIRVPDVQVREMRDLSPHLADSQPETCNDRQRIRTHCSSMPNA
jgi:hypothetical protein